MDKTILSFNHLAHPKDLGTKEIQTFLTYLAVTRNVVASTQNQALSALLFIKDVLKIELEYMTDITRAKQSTRVPVGAFGSRVKTNVPIIRNSLYSEPKYSQIFQLNFEQKTDICAHWNCIDVSSENAFNHNPMTNSC